MRNGNYKCPPSEIIASSIDDQWDLENDVTAKYDSYLDIPYDSELMKSLVEYNSLEFDNSGGMRQLSNKTYTYKPKEILPDWLVQSDDWKSLKGHKIANEVSDILKVPIDDRSSEQKMILVEWMMSVWPVASHMGAKRVANMMKEFVYTIYEPGDNIINEGERGLTFYIIVSGDVQVHKRGIGIVGRLTRGATFGEIALTNQSGDNNSDHRTATITVIGNNPVETLSLHKIDYDHFVRDIQLIEKRENFNILKESRLLQFWPRSKVEKLSNTAIRRLYMNVGDVIFRQGDTPYHIYFILEGEVKIIKEVSVIAKNKWPTGKDKWEETEKKCKKPVTLNILGRGEYFGEVAVLRNCNRTATAIVDSPRTVLILIDRLEFLHTFLIVSRQQSVTNIQDEVKRYKADSDVVRNVLLVKGGPNSYVKSGETVYYPNKTISDINSQSKTESKGMSRSFELKGDLDVAVNTIETYSNDIKKTLATLFPSINHNLSDIGENINQENKTVYRTRRGRRSLVHNQSNKISFHEVKTKCYIDGILQDVIEHETKRKQQKVIKKVLSPTTKDYLNRHKLRTIDSFIDNEPSPQKSIRLKNTISSSKLISPSTMKKNKYGFENMAFNPVKSRQMNGQIFTGTTTVELPVSPGQRGVINSTRVHDIPFPLHHREMETDYNDSGGLQYAKKMNVNTTDTSENEGLGPKPRSSKHNQLLSSIFNHSPVPSPKLSGKSKLSYRDTIAYNLDT